MTSAQFLDIMQLSIFIDVALWLICFCILWHILIFLSVWVSLKQASLVKYHYLLKATCFGAQTVPQNFGTIGKKENRKTLMKTSIKRPV